MDKTKFFMLLEQLRIVYTKHDINLSLQYLYQYAKYKGKKFYLLVNKSKETLKVTFADGVEFVTNDTLIVRDCEILSVYKLTLNIRGKDQASYPEIVYNVVNVKPLTPVSKVIQSELDCEEYINTNDKFDYLYCCKINPELLEYINVESRFSESGKTFNVYISQSDGQHLNTFLCSDYDPETGMIYGNSWSYLVSLLSKINNKLIGIPKHVIHQRLAGMRDSVRIIKNIVDNCKPEHVNSELIIQELQSFIVVLRAITDKDN